MNTIKLLAALIFSTGSLHERRSAYIVTAHCVKVNVQRFTQPRTQRPYGKMVCGRVMITANCLLPLSMKAVR
jgi:hypothetical protein